MPLIYPSVYEAHNVKYPVELLVESVLCPLLDIPKANCQLSALKYSLVNTHDLKYFDALRLF